MTESLQVIACPKCGGRTIKVRSLPNEDHFLCEGCQYDWNSEKSSDRRVSERRHPTRLVPPQCRNCPTHGGMVVETRTEHFVYYRCPACHDLFALRKPEGPIGLPPSTEIRDEELWRTSKGDRELRCIASYLPTGIELRMMEGAAIRRSELFQEMAELEQCAQLWRSKLTDRGWG